MRTGLRAWTGQRAKDVAKRGKKKAPWVVFWNDPDGKRREKSCGPGREGWRLAEKERQRLHGELVTGTYEDAKGGLWADFRVQYESHARGRVSIRTYGEIGTALAHFERLVSPGKLASITTRTIDTYAAKRRCERGKKRGDTVSPATLNKDLRHLKAALRKAHKWGFLPRLPEFEFQREPERDPVYMTEEDFATIYAGCDAVTKPHGLPYPASDWWRALLVTAYMTGWRIGETLRLKRTDVDLDAGTELLRAETTKGRRDAMVILHPTVVEHLHRIASFEPLIFPWKNHRRTLDIEFHRIQKLAGIHLPCNGEHEHTDACHLYGFHGERFAFATLNAEQLNPSKLQALMRHRSPQTTRRYVNMAKQLDGVVEQLHVPKVLRTGTGGK